MRNKQKRSVINHSIHTCKSLLSFIFHTTLYHRNIMEQLNSFQFQLTMMEDEMQEAISLFAQGKTQYRLLNLEERYQRMKSLETWKRKNGKSLPPLLQDHLEMIDLLNLSVDMRYAYSSPKIDDAIQSLLDGANDEHAS